MTEPGNEVLIRNLGEIGSTGERVTVAEVLSGAFHDLDPAGRSSSRIASVLEGAAANGKLYVIGFGKASLRMYDGVRKYTRDIAEYSGLIIPVGEQVEGEYPELEILRGDHPIPGEDTRKSSVKMLERIKGHGENDTIVVLVSGGGSALFEVPDDGFTIQQIGETAQCLMKAGADIHELNVVRHSMSAVKGGKLAGILWPSRVYSYVISDVPGDDLQIIASGPLVEPSYGSEKLGETITRFSGSCPMLDRLRNRDSGDALEKKWFSNVETTMILKNSDFVENIAMRLKNTGNEVLALNEPITGDVEDVASRLAAIAREKHEALGRPFWIVGGGETTAIVKGNGKGGRNCELSLRFALKMQKKERFTFASIGTDGIDGASPAMGGITDDSFRNAVSEGDIEASLSNSDSFTLLDRHHSAIMTGYTGTNVSDIFIIYYAGTVSGN